MAKHCNLSESQIEDLFKATYGSILASKNNNQKYNPQDFIKELYTMIFDASKDQTTALDYIQHIPKLINVAQANDDVVSDHLVESGVSMDQLIKLKKDFEASIDNVVSYLGLNTNQELETAIEIVEGSAAGSPVTNTQEYNEVEDADKQIKEANYRKTYVVSSDGTLTFIAKPTTGFALINQEAQNYGGVKAEQNILDSDVKKRNYFSLVRNINNLITGVDADDLTLGDVTGIFLRAMPAAKIALEDLYTEQQEYFNTSDEKGTSEEKLKKRETGDEILMVYTDKKGEILYFNENGIPTTKENGGTIAYATTRKVNVDAKGKKFIRSVQSITDLSNKPGAESVEDITSKRNSEIDTLQAMRDYVVKNPNEVLLFSVAPGKNGYIREDFSKRNLISSIQLGSGFNPFYSSIDDGPYQKGGVYFTVPDYDLPVLIQRPKFSEISNFVEDLAKVVFDSNLPTQKKISILKQFTYSEDTAVFEREGKVVIKQGKDTLNSDVAEDRQTFINNLNGQVVNINKYLLNKDFDMPVGGAVQTKKYNNFLSENFYTNLQKNDEGKLVKLNAYNVIQPTMDAAQKIFKVEEKPKETKESTLEQETPTDQSDDDFDRAIGDLDFGLKKLSTLSSAATEQQIADAKAWYQNSPLNKLMPFKEMFNVVNSDARAMFTKAGVTLFSGSNYTDLYHEGWHVFSQMFLTKADKKKLYGELRNLSGTFTTVDGKTKSFKDATDFQLEEFMAEDFRKYVLSGGKKIIDGRSARNNIFKRIYKFLKTLFTGQSVKSYLLNEEATSTLKDLYDKLYVGNINEYKPSLRNVQFTQLNKGAQELGATEGENKGLNYQDSMVLNETIDYLMADILQNKKVGVDDKPLGVGALFVNPKLMGPLYAEIKRRLSELAQSEDASKITDSGNKIIDFALTNWGDFNKVVEGQQETGVIAFHKQRSNFLSFDEKYSELTPSEQDDVDGEVNIDNNEDNQIGQTDAENRQMFGEKAFERKGTEHSVRSLASNEVVYLIKSLPKLDKQGKIEYNALGTPKLADFNRTWGIVINTVVGSVNKSEMYNKLLKASDVFPELKMLADRLQRPSSKVDPKTDNPYIQMWGAFFRDFSMYKIPIKELQIIKTTNSTKEGFNYEVRYVESEPVFKQVEKNFVTVFQTATGGKYINKVDGVNYLNLAKVFEDFPTTASLSEGNNALQFLKAVGFNLTDNADVRKNLVKGDIKNHINYIYLRFKDSINFKNIDNPISFLNSVRTDGKFKGRNNSTDVQKILEVEGKYSTNYTNNSITNVDGNLEHDISLNNSITQLFKELNDPNKKTYEEIVSQPHMAHLNIERNPHAKYNMLFNSMFDLPLAYKEVIPANKGQRRTIAVSGGVQPITMNLDNINGIKSILDIVADATVNEGGIKTANLDPNSKFLQDMHSMLESGVMEFTRRGSKSSAFGASVTEINSPYNEHDGGKVTAKHLYISPGYFFNKVTQSDPKGVILGYNYAVDIIKEQIAAEMERIAILKADIEVGGELSKIPGFNKRGLTFTMFDDILSKGLKKDLIDKADPKNSYQVVNSDEFKQRIADDVIKYLEKLSKENMEFFNEMPYMSDQLKKNLDKLGRAAGTIGDKSLVGPAQDAAIRAFTVNALIHNMQIIGLVDGDLAMYNHDKEEYNKRNTSVTSTGRIFSADKSDFVFINNLRAGNTYANKIGAAKRSFNGVLNTAIFKDNEIGSVYYQEYFDALMNTKKYTEAQVKKILKNYSPGKMNEGDAQGWITFDAYRELALLEGNAWSPKQNELYAKIIAGEEVDPTEIAEFFPPRKYQYAGPLQTDQLHIQAFHKYSLVPLVPSVIKSTNMRILHDNLVKQGFDYALFESGSKMATITKDGTPAPLYKDKAARTIEEWDGKEETKYASNPIFLQYLKNQVDIAPKWKNKTIFSTQLRKLIINDIFKKGVAKNAELESLVNQFEGLLTTLQSYKRQELLEEIGWTTTATGEPTGDKKKLIAFVRKEIARQDFADHDIEFIDLDASGNLKNDLSLSLNAEKIEKLLNSVVIKRLIRQKMNGEQLVQVSSAGFETSDRKDFSKASEEDIKKYRGTNDLPAYRPGKGKGGATTAMKVKIAMKGDYYKLLKLRDNNGREIETIERLNAMLKSDKWLDKNENRKMITMVGVRIPVQGLNSMEFMEIYEFLPEEAGNIIIPASEIVAKSGSDFDIDKLTIFQPNYSSSEDGYPSYSKGNNAKGTENKVIEVIRNILEHPDNFDALIRPNDTDLVKGTADNLAQFNIQGYDPLANKSQEKRTIEKNGKTVNVISPTRSLEQRYNLYKHESNNVGKKTLGIGAVDNSYSSIFKRIGAYLENSYTYKTANEKGNHERDVYIAMEHNSQVKNGKKYISLSDIDTTTMDKVSDLISQLMNGWVDVERDAWIFNINGNDVAGPVMLFLLEAGVDFKTAAYFISQPLVIDYIKERSRAQSPFYQASNTGVLNTKTLNSKATGQKGLDKYNIRKEFIRKYVGKIDTKEGKQGTREQFSSKIMYEKYIKPQTAGIKFTPNELLENIELQDKNSETSMRTLMHFFELEDMMRDLTNVKLTMNVDTKPSKTFFDAQSKILAIDNLRRTDIVSQEMLSDIRYKSPIASFFTQDFQLKLFKPMMKIRANKMINDFLIETIEEDFDDIMSTTFKDDAEKFVAAFKNDIPLFLLQNYIKGIDLTTLKEYKSLALDKTIPVQDAGQLKYGAFVKDGVMYVDADQINKDFDSKSFAGEGYARRGLHQVNPGTFAMSGNRQVDLQEYTHFVLEREALRFTTTVKEGQSRASFEKQIADQALINTYNFYTILKSPTSNANLFLYAAAKYAKELPGEYTIFEQVVPDKGFKDKGIKTLKFKSGKVEKDMANILHENLIRLADPDTVKIKDPKANAELSRFFGRFIISEYLRSGITKTNDSLAPILPTDVLMQLLREPMQNEINEQVIDEYSQLFKSNWAANRKKTRNKFRNYIKPKIVEIPAQRNLDEYNLVRENDKGLNVFNSPTGIEATKELVYNNPQYTLLYGGNAENLNEPKSDAFQKGASLSIPVKPGRGITKLWSDETYDDNVSAITKALDAIDEAKTSGQDVAFPEEGFTTVIERKDVVDSEGKVVKENGKTVKRNVPVDILRKNAPRTFDYLATQLYSRYGYVHPGAENALGFRSLFQQGQPVTDEMVDDFMKKCFGE